MFILIVKIIFIFSNFVFFILDKIIWFKEGGKSENLRVFSLVVIIFIKLFKFKVFLFKIFINLFKSVEIEFYVCLCLCVSFR